MTLLYAMSKTLHDAIIPQKPGSGHPVPGLSPCEGPSRPRTSRATSPVRFASCGSTSIRVELPGKLRTGELCKAG